MYVNEQQQPNGSGTAFRAAEKRYQLYKKELFRQKRGRRRSLGVVVLPTNLSDVLDPQPGSHLPGVTCLGVPSGLLSTAAAYQFPTHPGLLLVRGALGSSLQRQLVIDALTLFCEPPNHTNHIKAFPAGLPGIWAAAQQGLRLQQAAAQQLTTVQTEQQAPVAAAGGLWGPEGSGPTAGSLLQRLRWATLGTPYDWTQRLYLRDAVPHMPLPPLLHQLAVTLAGAAVEVLGEGGEGCNQEQTGQGAAYCPDAALVNYYSEGDTLNGHVDDAELSLGWPLVSLSLGCDAVFLIGGTSKEVPPTALLLRSGDAVVLSGHARRCYHGMPRVLTGRPLPTALRCCGGSSDDGGSAGEADNDFLPFERHMQRCRINISIRDTR